MPLPSRPDGLCGYSGGFDNTLRRWALNTGRCELTLIEAGVVCGVYPLDKDHVISAAERSIRLKSVPSQHPESFAIQRPLSMSQLSKEKLLSTDYLKNAEAALQAGNIAEALLLARKVTTLHGGHGMSDALKIIYLAGCYAKRCGIRSFRSLRSVCAHHLQVTAVVISPDNQWVLSAGGDKKVRLWDMVSGRCVQDLAGHDAYVTSVAFCSDGNCIISGKTLILQPLLILSIRTTRCLGTIRSRPRVGIKSIPDRFRLAPLIDWMSLNAVAAGARSALKSHPPKTYRTVHPRTPTETVAGAPCLYLP